MRLNDGLKAIIDERLISFHMPGHKNGRWLSSYFYDWMKVDLTEIPGSDHLHNPQGVIAETQEALARYYHTKRSFMLVNGATVGLQAAINTVCGPGDEVVIMRDCHRSVYSALVLGGIKAHYVFPEKVAHGALLPPADLTSVEAALDCHPDAKGLIVTSPNYHGVISDLKRLSEQVHDRGMVLIVDAAHGAHLRMDDHLPMDALEAGADLVVHSFHKTLPSLTQSAVLHCNSDRVDLDRLKQWLSMLQSSSPSYLLMASIDGALRLMEDEGPQLMGALLERIGAFKERIAVHGHLMVFDPAAHGWLGDPTRLVLIDKPSSHTDFFRLEEVLRAEYQIQIEYSFSEGIVLIPSIATTDEDFDVLAEALESVDFEVLSNAVEYGTIEYGRPLTERTLREAFYADQEKVPVKEAAGRICGDYVIPYPPGIPFVVPGECLTSAMVESIEALGRSGTEILGISEGQITVLKEEKC